jgi:hypothetical protein
MLSGRLHEASLQQRRETAVNRRLGLSHARGDFSQRSAFNACFSQHEKDVERADCV